MSLNVDAGVDDDPGDKKAGSAGEKSFFSEFPSPTVLSVVHPLDGGDPHVDEASRDGGERDDAEESLDGDDAPDEADDDPEELSSPVDDVEELFLVRPLATAGERLLYDTS